MTLLILSVLLVYLIIASYCDLKYLEVPDWLSYSLIFLGLSFGFGLSTINNNWFYLLESLVGLGLAYALSALFYYTGQWGGGDAKIMMGMGSFMGLSIDASFPFINLLSNSLMGFNLLSFVFFCMVGGAFFGVGFMVYKALKHFKKFKKSYLKRRKDTMQIFFLVLASTVALFILAFFLDYFPFQILSLMLGLLLFFGYFLFIFVRSVEDSSMVKEQRVEKLTPGDWLIEDVIIDGKKICAKRKTGLDEEDIKRLRKLARENKITKVKIRNGYPFVPGFLLGLILYSFIGNILLRLSSLIA
jgi:hypothetical protein